MSCLNRDSSASTANNSIPPPTLPSGRPGEGGAPWPFAGDSRAGAIHSCRFEQFPGDFTACSLPPGRAVPDWVGGAFLSFCRRAADSLILCATELVPSHVTGERDWQLFHVIESHGLSSVNLHSVLILPLKAHQVDVITVAESHGFCFLVRRHALPIALKSLQEAGHQFVARAGIESIPVRFLAT